MEHIPAVADPGFSRGGAPTPKSVIIFKCLPKTAWKLKNLDPGGGVRPWYPPLDPPMRPVHPEDISAETYLACPNPLIFTTSLL